MKRVIPDLARDGVIAWTTCGTCGAVEGQDCYDNTEFASERLRFFGDVHAGRRKRAQKLVIRVKNKVEWHVLLIALAAFILAGVVGVLFGDLLINYVWDVISPPLPEFPPTQLDTL